MKYQISTLAAALFLLAAPTVAMADSQCNEIATGNAATAVLPEKCQLELEKWVQSQPGTSSAYEGDIAVGTVLPESVTIVEYPEQKSYGYVMLNDRRVLVERGSRKVIRVW